MQTKIFGQIIAIGSKGMACAKPYWFGQAIVDNGINDYVCWQYLNLLGLLIRWLNLSWGRWRLLKAIIMFYFHKGFEDVQNNISDLLMKYSLATLRWYGEIILSITDAYQYYI